MFQIIFIYVLNHNLDSFQIYNIAFSVLFKGFRDIRDLTGDF